MYRFRQPLFQIFGVVAIAGHVVVIAQLNLQDYYKNTS